MITCTCFYQDGQIPSNIINQLGEGIENIGVSHKLGDGVDIQWIAIPAGQGWTAGEPSTSSVVTLNTPPIDQTQRIEILHDICNLWMELTDCQINEVLASVIPSA